MTRYPNVTFSYVNKGYNGDTANGAYGRLGYDIFNPIDPVANKVVILMGTNDMSRHSYFEGMELAAGADASRAALFESYKTKLTRLIDYIEDRGTIENIYLISPPLFDEWLLYEAGKSGTGYTNKPTSVDFNNVIRKAGAIQYEISKNYDNVYMVDVNTPQLIVEKYNFDKYGVAFTLVGDRVHPSKSAHWIMTYAFLKAQGESGEVATVEIDAAESEYIASKAIVSDLVASEGGVSYTYKADSLPIGTDSIYRGAEKYFPITDELNREIIKVKGLAEGVYDIKMDGALVMSASADQLEKGVNIADKQNNPGQIQSLKISGLAEARHDLDTKYRNFIVNEKSYISTYKLDSTSAETLISSAQTWIDNNPTKTSDINILQQFIHDKNWEAKTVAASKQFETEAYKRNKPTEHSVTITPSENEADSAAKAVYTNYNLPTQTLTIRPQTKAFGISVDNIAIVDMTNTPLTQLPTPGTTVIVRAVLTNNTDTDREVGFWSGAYNGLRLVKAIKSPSVKLAAGSSMPVAAQVVVSAGINKLKAGVWDAQKPLSPIIASATFPSDEQGISRIYINNTLLSDFDEDVYSYTYCMNRNETIVPYVNAVAKNSNTKINITQADEMGGYATVSAGDKTYSIRIIKKPDPVLSSLMVDSIEIKGFQYDVYSYNFELESDADGIVSASAGEGISTYIEQATNDNKMATITVSNDYGDSRVYSVNFMKMGTPGVVSNITRGGSATTAVTAVPSLGAPYPIVDIYNAYQHDEQRIAAVLDPELNPYISSTNAYSQYTNRSTGYAWNYVSGDGTNTYGAGAEFLYVANPASVLISPYVTRLYKSTSDPCESEEVASKAYTFDISKPANVFIATKATSAYILSKGWEYRTGSQYKFYTISRSTIVTASDGKKYIIPNGSVAEMTDLKGHVYVKHYMPGEKVEIPAFSVGSSSRTMSIFIAWDECNTEAEIFGITANGVQIEGFDKDTLTYTISASSVPVIDVIATMGANASVTQATSLSDSAVVTACGKTYTINFR